MKKVLKCSSCGGKLAKIEMEENTYVCLHCGNKEVIENDVTNNNYNITNNVVNHIYGNVEVEKAETSSGMSFTEYKERVEGFITIKEYKQAYDLLIELSKELPMQYLIWWYLAKVCLLARQDYLKNGTYHYFDVFKHKAFYEKACILASSKEREDIEKEYLSYKAIIHNISTENSKKNKKQALELLVLVCTPLLILFIVILLKNRH